MRIAVEGCAHGDLDKIYKTIQYIEESQKIKIDLLLCCGDFQAVRNQEDMLSMAVPPKYREMKDFHEYYNGRKKAPVLTIFVGGNHEAATHLWQLPYGGWVAENIYFLGYAGVVNYAGFRIGGLSGIFKNQDYFKGHFEVPPFCESTKRSFYHVRSEDAAKLKLLRPGELDIFISHDWPKNITDFGDAEQLKRFKPFLREEIESRSLGSDAGEELIKILKPKYWFAAHMHAKFSALVPHDDGSVTKFLALDKCLPHRNFMQIFDVGPAKAEPVLKYDKEWVTILRMTNDKFSCTARVSLCTDLRDQLDVGESELSETTRMLGSNFDVIQFEKSSGTFNTPQTDAFCERCQITNICSLLAPVSVSGRVGDESLPKTPSRTLSLPTPKVSSELKKKVKLAAVFDNPLTKSNEDVDSEDDEFGELRKPSIGLSTLRAGSSGEDSSDGSSSEDDADNSVHSSEDDDRPDVQKSSLYDSSFIDTPAQLKKHSANYGLNHTDPGNISSATSSSLTPFMEKKLVLPPRKGSSELGPCNISDSFSFSNECTPSKDWATSKNDPVTPTPNKKIKLVRRNQSMYTPTSDGES